MEDDLEDDSFYVEGIYLAKSVLGGFVTEEENAF